MIGLADCNSFYASCEKLFRPDLRGRPVVVLSNNDGCIVALSAEAKALGIRRGEPYFRCRSQLERCHVAVFSSNYTLYQDMSDRTVEILRSLACDVQPYSIDESFFGLPGGTDPETYAGRLYNTLKRRTGLTISVGIARTRTLAKVANHMAKHTRGWMVLREEDERAALASTAVSEVWGVGWRYQATLASLGLKTALDLACMGERRLDRFPVTFRRTVAELNGVACIESLPDVRRSFISGISFSVPKTSLAQIMQTLSCHCRNLSSKMARRNLAASEVFVQLGTDRFAEDYRLLECSAVLHRASNYAPDLMAAIRPALEAVFVPGLRYKNSRVGVFGLCPLECRQWSLFDDESLLEAARKRDTMAALVGQRGDLRTLTDSFGDKRRICRSEFLSPCYTTRWSDIPGAG